MRGEHAGAGDALGLAGAKSKNNNVASQESFWTSQLGLVLADPLVERVAQAPGPLVTPNQNDPKRRAKHHEHLKLMSPINSLEKRIKVYFGVLFPSH